MFAVNAAVLAVMVAAHREAGVTLVTSENLMFSIIMHSKIDAAFAEAHEGLTETETDALVEEYAVALTAELRK